MGSAYSGRQPALPHERRAGMDELPRVDVLAWHRVGRLTSGNAFGHGVAWERHGDPLPLLERLALDLADGLGEGRSLWVEVEDVGHLVAAYEAAEAARASGDFAEDEGSEEDLLPILPELVRVTHRWWPGSPAEEVGLAWAPCRLGGVRPWFLCPGLGCGRRCASLFASASGAGVGAGAGGVGSGRGGGPRLRCRRCLGLAYGSQRARREARLKERALKLRGRAAGGAPSLAALTLGGAFPERPKGMHRGTYERLRGEALAAERQWRAAAEAMWAKVRGASRASRTPAAGR